MNHRRIISTSALIIGTLLLSAGVQTFAASWTPPAGPPSSANAEAPLTTGIQTQTKSGGLILGAGLGMGTTSLLVKAGNAEVRGTVKMEGLLFNFGDLGPTPIATTRYINIDEDIYGAGGSGWPSCDGDIMNRYVCPVRATLKCMDTYGSTWMVFTRSGSTACTPGTLGCTLRVGPTTSVICSAIAVPTSFATSPNPDLKIASISGTVRHEKQVALQGTQVIYNAGDHVFFPVSSSFPSYTTIAGVTKSGIPTDGSSLYITGGLSGGGVSVSQYPSAANNYSLWIYFGHGGAGDGNYNIDVWIRQ